MTQQQPTYNPQFYGEPAQPQGQPIQPYNTYDQYGGNPQYASGYQQQPGAAYGQPQPAYAQPNAPVMSMSPDVAYGAGTAVPVATDQYYAQVDIQTPMKTDGDNARFSSAPPKYNDIIFAIAFVAHLVVLVIIATTSNSGNTSSGGTSIQSLIPQSEIGTLAAILVVSGVVGILVAFIWISVFKRYAKQLIHFTMGMAVVCFIIGGIIFISMGNIAFGVVMFLLAGLNMLFYFFWRRRIPFAALMLKSVGQLVQDFPQTVFVAFGAVIVGVLFLVLWSYTVAISAGNLQNGYLVQAFLLLSVYWTMQVIKNVVHVTVSGTFATWYFLQGTDSMPPSPTIGALRRTLTYSFGSVCFGSLLVALIKLLRAAVRQAQREDSILACLVGCILSCIDRLIQYFNTYAFVQVAMYGKSFIQAAKATWALIKRRGWDAIINDNLIDGVLLMGSCIGGVVTAVVGGGWAYVKLHTFWMYVAFLAFVIGFAMVMIVMQVVNSGVVTMFVCLAEEPSILKQRNPELFDKFQETYALDLA